MSIVCKLYDLDSNELADISSVSLEKSMKARMNQAGVFTIQAPAASSLFATVAGDGYKNLRRGNRKLLVWEDGTIIFHGRVFTIERNGDGQQELLTITAMTPLAELGYDGNDQAGRPVRDATGNFINPTFTGTGTGGAGVISGPDLIYQVMTNSQGTDSEGGAHPGEGPLPIDLTTGTFDLDIPPAVDLSCLDTMDWPILIGDFIQQLTDSGVCDIYERPVDPTEGLDPYVMTALSAVSALGTDRHASVHFDYRTGSKNAATVKHVEDFTTINNKLYDYLGPRISQTEWRANITPGSSGTTVDPTASRALYGGPGTHKGEFMSIRVLDSIGSEASSRPLYIALWNAEQGFRVEPAGQLYITPSPAGAGLFTAPQNFDLGDLVGSNIGSALGVSLADIQRVYGWDKTWSREGVPSLGQLVCSADEE